MKNAVKTAEAQLKVMQQEKDSAEEQHKLDLFMTLFNNWENIKKSLQLKSEMCWHQDGTVVHSREFNYYNLHEYVSLLKGNEMIDSKTREKLTFPEVFYCLKNERLFGNEQKNIIENINTSFANYLRNFAFILEYVSKSKNNLIFEFLNENIDNDDIFIVSSFVNIPELHKFHGNDSLVRKFKKYLIIHKDCSCTENKLKNIRMPNSLRFD